MTGKLKQSFQSLLQRMGEGSGGWGFRGAAPQPASGRGWWGRWKASGRDLMVTARSRRVSKCSSSLLSVSFHTDD